MVQFCDVFPFSGKTNIWVWSTGVAVLKDSFWTFQYKQNRPWLSWTEGLLIASNCQFPNRLRWEVCLHFTQVTRCETCLDIHACTDSLSKVLWTARMNEFHTCTINSWQVLVCSCSGQRVIVLFLLTPRIWGMFLLTPRIWGICCTKKWILCTPHFVPNSRDV